MLSEFINCVDIDVDEAAGKLQHIIQDCGGNMNVKRFKYKGY